MVEVCRENGKAVFHYVCDLCKNRMTNGNFIYPIDGNQDFIGPTIYHSHTNCTSALQRKLSRTIGYGVNSDFYVDTVENLLVELLKTLE